MEFTLRQRAERLKKLVDDYPAKMAELARLGTIRAVEKATDLTPPAADDFAGTNTRSGEMQQHWATDSDIVPHREGDKYVTTLANDKQYASYVNDGHRMDRHFVPGLYINPDTGQLERNPDGSGGLVVGTKTHYVEGLHMVEAAEEVYKKTIQKEIDRLVKEAEQ